MKSKIFMYLFFFAVLFIIFQYMNEKSIFENQEQQIESLTAKLTKAEDSLGVMNERVTDLNYFTLQGNDNAMTYLENFGFEAAEVETRVANFIYDQNLKEGSNPLVPYEGLNGPMKISKIKFLNHRWILADFTDGKYWGEMILEYYFNDNKELELITLGSLLYPSN
jgi:hypothetical protein